MARMSRRDDYRGQLDRAPDVVTFLRTHSNLPGPRANLELVQAAADFGDERAFRRWIEAGAGADPTDEFLVVCGVVGLGRLAAAGNTQVIATLRGHAADPRWRVREGVAMALQRLGDQDMDALFRVLEAWAGARPYLQRAAIAAVSEPRLLKAPAASRRALALLDRVTRSFAAATDRRSEEYRTLRQALGYCWSVVVAANPAPGKPVFSRWARSTDPDLDWIVRENLTKARLAKIIT